MTVIGAIPGKDGCIAADRLHTLGHMRWSHESKIRLLPNGALVANTGRMDGNNLIYDWYSSQKKPACLDREESPWFSGLLLKPNGDLWCFYSSLDFPIKSDHEVFMGSGGDLALAHYNAHADIRSALEFVCDNNIVCGGGVDYYKTGDTSAPELDILFKSDLP